MKMFWILTMLMFSFSVFGESVPVTPVAPLVQQVEVVAPAVPSKGEAAVSSLKSAVDKIPTSVPGWMIAVMAFLIEVSMRLWPTVKPRSVFILAGQACSLIAAGFNKISSLLDSLVQNIKE